MHHETTDPYRFCHRESCEHDLVKGVLTAELLAVDGPHPHANSQLLSRNPERRQPIVRAA